MREQIEVGPRPRLKKDIVIPFGAPKPVEYPIEDDTRVVLQAEIREELEKDPVNPLYQRKVRYAILSGHIIQEYLDDAAQPQQLITPVRQKAERGVGTPCFTITGRQDNTQYNFTTY